MNNQFIISNNELKAHETQNIKNKKSHAIINKKGRRANIKKGKGVKKNKKLSSDEKNFLAILVHRFLKKEISAGGKITKSREIKKTYAQYEIGSFFSASHWPGFVHPRLAFRSPSLVRALHESRQQLCSSGAARQLCPPDPLCRLLFQRCRCHHHGA